MKNNNLIMSVAISAIFLIAMTSIVQIIPIVHAYPDVDCVCNHWDINDENTDDDIFTGTGIDGNDVGSTFDYADFWFTAGSGGNYVPKPSSGMLCYRKYQDTNYNWFGPYTVGYTGDWEEDIDPFPYDGDPYTYEYYREYTPRYSYSSTRRYMGLTTNWFQNPSSPATWVLIGASWADIIA